MIRRRLPLSLSLIAALAVMLAAALEARGAHATGFEICADGTTIEVTADGRPAPPEHVCPDCTPQGLAPALPPRPRAPRAPLTRRRRTASPASGSPRLPPRARAPPCGPQARHASQFQGSQP